MRAPSTWALLLFIGLTVTGSSAYGQAPESHRAASPAILGGPWPPHPAIAAAITRVSFASAVDSAPRRPFFLPRPGEHAAFWIGFGTGVALSPLLWCEGAGCSAFDKMGTSWLLGVGGVISGLLLKRTL